MTFELFNDRLQAAGFIVVVVFTPLAVAAVILRFMSTRITLGKHGKEDWFALGSLVFYLGWIAISVLIVPALNGQSDILSLPVERSQEVLKLIWIANLMFPPNQLCAKLSILFLYYRIFRIKGSTYVLWIKVLGFLQVIVSLISLILNIVQCLPIQKAWVPSMENGSCVNVSAMLAGTETSNSLLDFAIGVFAVVALRSVQTTSSAKWKLAIVFAIGGFAGVIGFIKIGLAFNVSTYNQLSMDLWAIVQGALSVICCCAMTYKPILARIGSLVSKVLSHRSREESREKSSGEQEHKYRVGWVDLERADGYAGATTASRLSTR